VRSKSIAELEGVDWPEPGPTTSPHFVRCYELRKKPISSMTIQDLRVLIGQDIGLEYLVPSALSAVEKDPLLEAEHYKGDLLAVILQASAKFFDQHSELRSRVGKVLGLTI
jgi:hypothetical protein